MRIAFISDIHANYTALQAVAADMEGQEIDRVISLGDIATLGPQPIEVLSKLRTLDCICILGNHDAAILDPARSAELQITEHLVPDLHWGRDRLSEADLDYIDSFLPTHQFSFPNGASVLCFHGSPLASTDLILSTTPEAILDRYLENQTADIFIGGHSHIQLHRRFGDKLILNSGSVGNAFMHAYQPGSVPKLLPWAEYAIVSQNGDSLDVDLRRVHFDTAELLALVAASGLPGAIWWSQQY